MTPKDRRIKKNELSARDVLEKIALEIYNKEKEKEYPYEKELKGILWKARFSDGLSGSFGDVRPGPSYSCDLDHIFYTNINNGYSPARNPCHERKENRFDENAEAYCNNDKIRGIGKKSDGTACAPFRRQNLCDKNLEYLNNNNTETTHDLLGNVLVTAKYEGDSIVEKHPHKDINGNKSSICTALARSFADIGDIVRGKDMFKRNDKDEVKKGLKVVFQKIYESLSYQARKYYADNDKSGNYVKLREDWWKANRDQVWEAITCNAPEDANYFRKESDGSKLFANAGKCRRHGNSVPTNLDYVPQFVRWFDEWVEEFCRIRNHKLQKVKEECRGKYVGDKYCSGDGEDCKKIVRQDFNNVSDFFCPSCKTECTNYKKWIDTKQGEFNEQKKKYEKEISNVVINSDSTYDRKVYENLKSRYPLDTQFLEILKEAPYCNNNNVDGTIDFNKPDDTFSRSTYCASCPAFGVICKKDKCNEVTEDEWCNMKGIVPKIITNKEGPNNIGILVSDDTVNGITNGLKDYCDNSGIFKGIRKDEWLCKYLCYLDVCELTNDNNNKHIDKRISIRVLFKRWLEYFFKDYSTLKKKLNSCTNNVEKSICINECKKKCECVGKWADEKRQEWEKVRKRYLSQYNIGGSDEVYTVRSFVNGNVDPSYIKNALNEGENLDKLQDSHGCIKSHNSKKDTCVNDVIYILIDRLKKKIDDCKKQHDEKTHQICCDELPESKEDDEEEGKKKKKNVKDLEVTNEKKEQDEKKLFESCQKMKKIITENNGKIIKNHRCNAKTDREWDCSTKQIPTNQRGACMPPRRQSLCIRPLRYLFENGGNKKIDDYKNAFTECASIETHFAWTYYNGQNRDAEKELKVGKIPNDFLRIMYYTFGDYKDIFFGTDISKDVNIKNISNKIKALMEENYSKATGHKGENLNSKLQSSWEEYKREIWKGMLCGLTYDITSEEKKKDILKKLNKKYKYPCDLESFASKPQFLRWFIEWSEDYCRKYNVEYEKLRTACNTVDCSKDPGDSQKEKCKTTCASFKTFVESWKKQYDSQKDKFNKLKTEATVKNIYKDIENKEAHEYLADECKGKCDCIKDKTEYNTNGNDLKVFDIPPKEQKDNCECVLRKKSACENNELPEGRTQSQMTCSDLKNEYTNSKNNNIGIYPKLNHTSFLNKSNLIGLGAQWKKITNGDPIYVSPRTRQLCLKHVIDIGRSNSTASNITEKQFIQALQKDAYAEGRLLYMYYNSNGKISIFKNGEKEKLEDIEKHIHEAIKRSYADYGDLIKGTTQYTQYNDYADFNDIIKNVTKTRNTDSPNNIRKREEFWTKYKGDIWNAMLCGYNDGIDSDNNLMKNNELCKLPDIDGENEFLRWFKEWNENFCITQVKREDKLKNECINFNCFSTKSKKDDAKTKCVRACINYKNFVIESNKQYKEQKNIYNEKHKNNTNKDIPTFLKQNCINKNCDCISIKFSHNDNWEKYFDSLDRSDIKNKCECLKLEEESNTIRRYIPKGDPNYHPEYKDDGKVNYKYEKGKPKALPSIYPMNCAEKVADELRRHAENTLDINTKLKATKTHGIYKTEQNATNNDISCKIHNNTTNGKKYTCENNGNTFHDNDEWDCNKGTNKLYENDICLPPRRKHMCTKQLENIRTASIKTTDDLLKEVLITGVSEGKRLKQQWEKTENGAHKKKKHFLCDAMKYSFADLADIIKGTDIWKGNREQQKIQKRLVTIFRNIYDNLEKNEHEKYKYGTKFQNLRSAWWDAHRKEIWNAMTCSAPDDCFFVKRGKGDGSDIEFLTFSKHKKCGHNKEPPVYDYVPQILRWITEWSEHFCELQEKNYYLLKEKCTDYIEKDSKSIDDSHNMKCNTCKTKCEEYSKFIKKWNSQYNNLEKKFKELYDKANNIKTYDEFFRNGKLSRRNHYEDENTIKFLQKVKSECKEPNTVDKYLMYTSDCRRVKFSNTNDTNLNKPTADVNGSSINGPSSNLTSGTETNINYALREYAFEIPPNDYKNACICIGPEPLDRCPENDNTSNYCNNFVTTTECTAKTYNDDLHVWNNANVKFKTGINNGVLVPPRRRHICLTNMITKQYEKQKNGMENFKTDLLQVAYNEGYFLCKKYDKEYRSALEAMKYTFADIADIVKGRDMINNDIYAKLRKLLDNQVEPRSPRKWWKNNRTHIWNAMLCGYKKGGGTITNDECNVPDEEYTYQFLRWIQEWTETFCTGRQKLYEKLNNDCKSTECDTTNGTIGNNCTIACQEYSNYISRKKDEYLSLKSHYDMNYRTSKKGITEAHEYFKDKCKDAKCACLDEKLNIEDNWKKPYETLDDSLKSKCDCKKIETPPPPPPPLPKPEVPPPPHLEPLPSDETFDSTMLQTTIPFGIALALGSIAFLFIKKKPKSPVDLLRVIDIHKGDYGIPTFKSKNRYIPYKSAQYKGKTYLYVEGDTDEEKYAFMSDNSDITSSESEYEEMDINDIYPYTPPKYKTLIEVVLEPSKRDTQSDIQGDNTHTNKPITDDEWNEVKQNFISQYLQNTEPNILHDNVDNNTQPNTLYFDKPQEKPFITSIYDRDLYTGEEISYNINMSTNTNNDIPISSKNDVYSGIDLINDTLNSGNKHIDIYDEVLKRKENELFGTKHPKRTSNNSVAKLTNSYPIMNQLDLFHKWLDRHRDMCEQWNNKEELLDKLKEEWNKDNDGGDIYTSNGNKTLNTNVSIEIDMDNPKPINIVDINPDNYSMDTMEDDIYYDVNDDENPSVDDISMNHNKLDVPKKVHVEMKNLNNTSNGSLKQEFPISDVWNI
ncbi:erythrocyte membrane protein 1, PfEMP1, putative [Plasmodium reichenowi]|uniref:Erythrocyte membrane protein 1, PfEMP1, putative n=1 Tax=Plasmodium reichenowi TaxID=5854 RepID=A0A2P9DT95_PLARE|nr:erythrocyte membrane protein 1, PfEMP1, putative [Plasmodium reichenowi]